MCFLYDLEQAGLVPSLIVTTTDKSQGRGMDVVAPPAKQWAEARGILLQPESFDNAAVVALRSQDFDVFVIIYYGKVLPRAVLTSPKGRIEYPLLSFPDGAAPLQCARQ